MVIADMLICDPGFARNTDQHITPALSPKKKGCNYLQPFEMKITRPEVTNDNYKYYSNLN